MESRISQVDEPQFLFTRGAAVLLGFAATLSLSAVIILHSDFTFDAPGPVNRKALLVAGIASAMGFVSLLMGMVGFWLKCDVSSERRRTVWFFVLLLGCAYGSQIAYYAFVYLPSVVERLRNPRDEPTATLPAQGRGRRKVPGPYGWALIVGWVLFIVTVAAYFTFPVRMYVILRPVVVAFMMWPLFMLAATAVYGIVWIFKVGMRRSADSSKARVSDHPRLQRN